MRWLVLCCLILAGCDSSPSKEVRAQRKADRTARAEAAALQPPKVARHRFDTGELLVIDVPTVSDGGFADSQKCFLWRDAEFKTASLQCPANATGDLPDIQ